MGQHDFHHVDPEHREIDSRLWNWAIWSRSSQGSSSTPIFRKAQCEQPRTSGQSLDKEDAARIACAVSSLPVPHRSTINWHYITYVAPRKAAHKIGVTVSGLYDLLQSARGKLHQFFLDPKAPKRLK